MVSDRRIQALEIQTDIGRVTVHLPKHVEDEVKAVEAALRGSGYDPATTQVVSIWQDEMFEVPFASPFMTHEGKLKLLG